MAQITSSFIEMLKKFGGDLGLHKVDVDKLIETQRKNIDALGKAAGVASEGAKSLAEKQREIIKAAFHEASTLARDFKPVGTPKEVIAQQAQFAKKAFDITLQNTRDIAELATRTTGDAVSIIQTRLRESLDELRDNMRHSKDQSSAKEK